MGVGWRGNGFTVIKLNRKDEEGRGEVAGFLRGDIRWMNGKGPAAGERRGGGGVWVVGGECCSVHCGRGDTIRVAVGIDFDFGLIWHLCLMNSRESRCSNLTPFRSSNSSEIVASACIEHLF